MCRLCDATGPLCRYLTDQDWATTTSAPRSHNPLPPDDILEQLHQTWCSEAVDCPEPDRPRHGRPKAAVRGKPVQKTGTSPPKPAVRPNRLRWPALTSGTHCAVTLTVPGAQSPMGPRPGVRRGGRRQVAHPAAGEVEPAGAVRLALRPVRAGASGSPKAATAPTTGRAWR